jgi:hypothetical protein
MTVAEAKAAPDKVTTIPPVVLGPKGAPKDQGLKAQRLQARTTLLGHPATCELVFAVNERLSQVSCKLDGRKEVGDHRDLEAAVLKALRGRYGSERRSWPHGVLADERGPVKRTYHGRHYRAYRPWERLGRWAWWDEQARLELVSEFERLGYRRTSSVIEVRNTAASHEALVEKLQATPADSSDL